MTHTFRDPAAATAAAATGSTGPDANRTSAPAGAPSSRCVSTHVGTDPYGQPPPSRSTHS